MSPKSSWLGRATAVLLPRRSATSLALLRFGIFVYILNFLNEARGGFLRVAASKGDIFHPVGIASYLEAPIDPGLHQVLYDATLISCALATMGFLYRLSGPIFGLLLLFILTYRQSWGFIYHTENLMVVHALVLGFSPAADEISLDSWISEASKHPMVGRFFGPFENPGQVNWKYGFPVQLMVFVTGITYWVAGMAKLGRGGGLNWALDAHLLGHVGNNAMRYHFLEGGAKEITYEIYSWPPWVIVCLSVGSLLMEVGAPLAVLHRYLALAIAVALYCFHWGVYAIMGIPFTYQLDGIAFLPFLPLDPVLGWLKRRSAKWTRPSGA